MYKKIIWIIVILLVIGGFDYIRAKSPFEDLVKSESSTSTNPISFSSTDTDLLFKKDVKPVLDTRCVVCHACYDAPCQVKLGSYEGIMRGAHKERVYNGKRLVQTQLTRLFEDAQSTKQWRDKGFFPVVDNANVNGSTLAHMLDLKNDYPLPEQKTLSDEFSFDINREYQCPTMDEISDYKQEYPLWGMPYALPGLSEQEHNVLLQWIEQGAKGSDNSSISNQASNAIQQWEAFFNQDSLQAQLMSRYLFEHLFLTHINFSKQSTEFFKIVRSKTPPSEPIDGIYTRRPFDPPGVARVYYRFVPIKQTLVHKSHMPILLDKERMASYKSWFLNDNYSVKKLPSYKATEASNPFITFAQIPVSSRYRFMLSEAQNTIMQFIKGPVCRGQLALNVINDHFWVVFLSPDNDLAESDNTFMQKALQEIALPAEEQSNALPVGWLKYATMERKYLKRKSNFLAKQDNSEIAINTSLLWDGDENNDNLALTVFRHKDAATVVKGLVGDNPQTAWVLSYPLFERIHYLLVAGYDVYGNVGHQLNSRMYMDFLRMEGEFNFLTFLPQDVQEKVHQQWYRGSVSEVEKFVYDANSVLLTTDIEYESEQPLNELYGLLKKAVTHNESQKHHLDDSFLTDSAITAMDNINQLSGIGVSLLPESTIIKVHHQASGQAQFYTMLRHSAHTNISHLFDEEDRRIPKEDTVTIAKGFITSHPNQFMTVSMKDLEKLHNMLAKMKKQEDFVQLLDKFGVRRTDAKFWQYSDDMHDYFKTTYPVEFGYLDFNRLLNQ